MAIIKNGSFTVVAGGAAQTLNLGFIPTRYTMWNMTLTTATPTTGGILSAMWNPSMANGTAILDKSYSVGTTPAVNYSIQRLLLASNGITPFQSTDATLWTETNRTITAITKAANAQITSTGHGFTTSDVGVTTVTISGVVGMTQINTLRGVIQSIVDANNFTVNINTTTFSTYTSGGIANVITGIPPFEQVGFQVFNTPQHNTGFIGLTLGTSVMANTSDLWYYEAVLDAPFTSA